jgi:two-component system, OmpR family, sensor histidine kinase CreC
MHLGLRLLFGFFVVAGLAAGALLHVVLREVKPSVREVMEDLMVDAAHVLAETAATDLAAMPPGGTLAGSGFARAVAATAVRPVQARIWGLEKTSLDLRVLVTDATGRVVFDSGPGAALNEDHSRWRDVARTLRGEYGARSTREVAGDDKSTVLHVAAPVRAADGAVLGVLTVAKPLATVQPFIDRAERKILVAGLWLLAASLVVGLLVTAWVVHAVRKLRRYAQQAQLGATAATPAVPALPGELGELAQAMGDMRRRLDGRAAVEQAVRALTHEIKSPLTAISGAAELLHEPLAEADRRRFARDIAEQADRARELVDRQLEFSKLESLDAIQEPERFELPALLEEAACEWRSTLAQRGLTLELSMTPVAVNGDRAQLRLAVSNLLSNAADFAPAGSRVRLSLAHARGEARIAVHDTGPGVPAYALAQLGQRYFSTPRPHDGRKGSGLGLAIVRRVAELHRGSVRLANLEPGFSAEIALPTA